MLGAVDVGSNTLRLLLGEVAGGRVTPFRYERRITRLGGGLTAAAGLTPEAWARSLGALREFAAILGDARPREIRAVCTAAVRTAVNGHEFIETARQATGIPLAIISGDEEAQLTASGVLAALEPLPPACLIVDIGGGSTEFILVIEGRVTTATSLPLGVVRLIEDCSGRDARSAVIEGAVSAVAEACVGACRRRGIDPTKLPVVGTAGTATTLAALDQEMIDYDWQKVNNYRMSAERLHAWSARLAALTVAERERLPGMEAGRGDLIIAGTEILQGLFAQLHAEQLIISDFGLLEGLLRSLAGDHSSACRN